MTVSTKDESFGRHSSEVTWSGQTEMTSITLRAGYHDSTLRELSLLLGWGWGGRPGADPGRPQPGPLRRRGARAGEGDAQPIRSRSAVRVACTCLHEVRSQGA